VKDQLRQLQDKSDKVPKSNTNTEQFINSCKLSLMNYIIERSDKKKYTGSSWGYTRDAKVKAAQSLIDLLSSRISPFTFFSPLNKLSTKNLAALKQGHLKDVAKEALEYCRNTFEAYKSIY